MGTQTKISWTDKTWSPWLGCSKVSAGCKNCYAENLIDSRYKKAAWGKDGWRTATAESGWRKLKGWSNQALANGRRTTVFPSLCDPFELWEGEVLSPDQSAHYTSDRDASEMVASTNAGGCDMDGYHYTTLADMRARFFQVIEQTPGLSWLLLTKRPENVVRCLEETGRSVDWLKETGNVWLGVSIEDQENADKRLPVLMNLETPRTFASIEPMLGPISLCREETDGIHPLNGLNYVRLNGQRCVHPRRLPPLRWVVAGGESQPGARPSHPHWYRMLRDECKRYKTPFHFKQWGEWLPRSEWVHKYADAENKADAFRDWEKAPRHAFVHLDGTHEITDGPDRPDEEFGLRCFDLDGNNFAAACMWAGKKNDPATLDGELIQQFPPELFELEGVA